MRADTWRDEAICAQTAPDIFTPESYAAADVNAAKRVCAGCPVRRPCLDAAMEEEGGQHFRQRAGVRGGTTPRQRWRMQQREAA
ncbi:WhiB family transcriptional regulator [Streptomyces rimosus]|uniref:WhiB family transcriptional regulator n=1 Tax=Streptomyces rimosus TaxID=1927 RepID=UPI000519C158|nr:WhiB family transcriptional regulator [Streptomyces rimosus]